ncbi:hypothetical protein I3500192B8_02960 [Acidaminococcus intestini]|uniref:hypothetical protein n=1 Tax=Acidaminococcus intestini TaxID=187327 RepID=UPI0036F1F069
MSVQKLAFAEPFFEVVYIEAEEKYFVGPRSLVFNLAHKSNKMLSLRDMTLAPLKGSVVSGVEIQDVDRALVFLDFAKTDIEDPEIVERIKQTWRSLYQCSGQERHRGLPYYKSPKIRIGGDTEINVCYVDAPMYPSGPHRYHDRNFDEVHAQILGMGMMQKVESREWEEKQKVKVYQEFIMAPGTVHDKFYDSEGNYPWHQYCSITPCVYMPIEIDR